MTNDRYKFSKINFDANNLKSDYHLEKQIVLFTSMKSL